MSLCLFHVSCFSSINTTVFPLFYQTLPWKFLHHVFLTLFLLFLPLFLIHFMTLPPVTASLAVEWGVLSVSGMPVTGQNIWRKAAVCREFAKVGLRAEMESQGLEEVKRRGRVSWGRADKHERSNKRKEDLRKENKQWTEEFNRGGWRCVNEKERQKI